MSETSVEWSDLQLFLVVARERGLSPAARITGRSAATLGRRMLALERTLGRELFIRHDRGYALTADAQALLDELSDIEGRITRIVIPTSTQHQPLIKVSAGTWTTLALMGQLDQITGIPPELRIRFIQAEATLSITRRETIIGFRNTRPTEPELVCRKLMRVEFCGYKTAAAPNLWIQVNSKTPSAKWVQKQAGNNVLCEVNTPRSSLDLAHSGSGVALLPTFIGDNQSGLNRIGATIPELAHDQWIVTHQDDRRLPEVRKAIDRMSAALERNQR